MAIRIETTGSSWRNGCLASHTTEQVTSAQGQHKQLCPHHLVSGVVKAVMFLSDNKKKAPSLSCNIYYRWLEPWIAFELTQKQSPTSDRLHMAEYTLHLTALEKLSVLEIKWLRLPCQVSFSSRHWERAHSRAQESFVVWLDSSGTLQKSYEKNCHRGWGRGASHLAQMVAVAYCKSSIGPFPVQGESPASRTVEGPGTSTPSLPTTSPGLLDGGLWLRKDGSEKLQALVHPLFILRGQLAFIQDLRKQRRTLKLFETTRMNS